MLKTKDILRGVENCQLAWDVPSNLGFRAIVNDSRLAAPGSLFVALRGERDGHDYITDAHAHGASGVLAERLTANLDWLPASERQSFAYFVVPDSLRALQDLAAYWRALYSVETVGITGSVGKTTTKEIVARVLSERFRVLKNEKNLNNEIGLPLSLLRLSRRHQIAVLEMGMYAVGEIATLCRLSRPRIGVVTNVGPMHLERLGSLERIVAAKSELVQALPVDGLAILNGDDERVRGMVPLARGRVLTFGCAPDCDLRATDVVSHGLQGIEFTVRGPHGAQRVATTLLGKQAIYASLAGVAVGLELGVPAEDIAAALRKPPRQLRLSLVKGPFGSTIIDDTYNAGPDSVSAALEVLSEAAGRRVAILADMLELGTLEEAGHRKVGRKAAECVDVLITVGPRARFIADEARAAGLRDVHEFAARDDVHLDIKRGDVILIKGSRGMRMEELVARLARLRTAPFGGKPC